ncbi:DUF3619 family protein [Caenimonas terrae]|uniref:DUF3619 family protein n=1 Tax=Caenimonas terrae TaxID=696074 RepID=A0ABW0NEF4_9BURK
MNTTQHQNASRAQDGFGRQVAARLTLGTAELPYDITERLRAARTQAMAKRKLVSAQPAPVVAASGGGTATLGFGDEGVSWWNRIASALPLLVLAVGLVTIHVVQNERRASEVAEVDAAILTDDLPPAAYADPGFTQFLKTSGTE